MTTEPEAPAAPEETPAERVARIVESAIAEAASLGAFTVIVMAATPDGAYNVRGQGPSLAMAGLLDMAGEKMRQSLLQQ